MKCSLFGLPTNSVSIEFSRNFSTIFEIQNGIVTKRGQQFSQRFFRKPYTYTFWGILGGGFIDF